MKSTIVGLDLGNSVTKVVTPDGEFKFPSRIREDFDEFDQTKKIKVVYNNTLYSLGVGSDNINDAKYFSEAYKIMLLTAIAKSIPVDAEKEINVSTLVIGLPIDVYRNKQKKEKIKKHIESYQQQRIIVDDEEYLIVINTVEIWAEGAVMLVNPGYYAKRKVVILDIGGKTQDAVEVSYKKIGTSQSNKLGILSVKEKIAAVFKKEYEINELDDDAKEEFFKSVIGNKNFILGSQELDISKFESYVRNYISSTFDFLEKNFNLSDKEILFIGGGSLALKKYILEYKDTYSLDIDKDGDMLNAKTYLQYADKISE